MAKTSRLASLIAELRRRHVFRVALVYGAVAWLLVQMADVVFPALALPPWTITLVVLLVLIGFPIAMLLAWAYDITPAGVRRTPSETGATTGDAAPDESPRPRRPHDAATRSIAALPFVNLSPETADDWFSDGLTEELINALTRVRGLRVVARTSAFAFKDSALDVRAIGEQLDVRHVLEGSVRAAGNRLRMAVQLIDVDNGYCLWSETFDREMGDVFRIQQEIADAVVERILTEQSAGSGTHDQPTDSLEAFQHYLRGRYFWNRRTEPDLRRAIDEFRQAVAADPGYALAHAGLADAWAILLDHGLAAPQEALPHATRAAERALQLDPELAEAHTSSALTRQFDGQWDAAESAFREALRCNPSYPVAHHRYALFLAWMGRADEALARIEEARRLDPISLIIRASIGWILYYARRFDDATRHLAGTLEMDPHYTNAHIARALVLAATGRAADAIEPLETALHDSGGSAPILALLAYACGAAGDPERARELNTRLEARSRDGFVAPYYRALPHLGLAEPAAALDWLERARLERSAQMIYIATDPIWDPVRTDPRFQSIVARLRFPAAAVR